MTITIDLTTESNMEAFAKALFDAAKGGQPVSLEAVAKEAGTLASRVKDASLRRLTGKQCICLNCGLSETGPIGLREYGRTYSLCVYGCETESGHPQIVFTQADLDEEGLEASAADIEKIKAWFPNLEIAEVA